MKSKGETQARGCDCGPGQRINTECHLVGMCVYVGGGLQGQGPQEWGGDHRACGLRAPRHMHRREQSYLESVFMGSGAITLGFTSCRYFFAFTFLPLCWFFFLFLWLFFTSTF